MVAGTWGGLLATWVTFTPCFLWIFLGAPFIEALRNNKSLNAALSAITAAIVGVVLNLASLGARALGRRRRRDLPLQGRDDPNARRMLRSRHLSLSRWSVVMSRSWVLAAALLFLATSPATAQRISFGDTPSGSKPKDFETALTGGGKPGQWQVVEDATAEGGRALGAYSAAAAETRAAPAGKSRH